MDQMEYCWLFKVSAPILFEHFTLDSCTVRKDTVNKVIDRLVWLHGSFSVIKILHSL